MLNTIRRKATIRAVSQQRSYAGAADLKILKRRQKTVTQIGKITGVLKVVAQSRLQTALDKAAQTTAFFQSTNKIFQPIADKIQEDSANLSIITVIIYTDRGLCGPCNNGINRMLDKETLENQQVVIWGEKGCSGFEKSKHKNKVLFSAHPSLRTPLAYAEVTNFISQIQEKECDLYRIIYNKMTGPNTSDIAELWLPSLSLLDKESSRESLATYEIEAVSHDEVMQNLHEHLLSSAINHAVFQNNAVELFQRRNSMQNASQNAKEVVKKIKLKYNKARQGMITTELGEIVSGAAAVDAMIKGRK